MDLHVFPIPIPPPTSPSKHVYYLGWNRNAELFFNEGQVCGDTNSLKKAQQNPDLKKIKEYIQNIFRSLVNTELCISLAIVIC